MVILDKSSFPFWIDKYKMTELFTQDSLLSNFKPKWGNYEKTYQPTMRITFLLIYHNHQHLVHFLGRYWKTPLVSLDEDGDFMEKNKDIYELPYYLALDPKTMHNVQEELKIALPLLHSKTIQHHSDSQIPFDIPKSQCNLQIIAKDNNISLENAMKHLLMINSTITPHDDEIY